MFSLREVNFSKNPKYTIRDKEKIDNHKGDADEDMSDNPFSIFQAVPEG